MAGNRRTRRDRLASSLGGQLVAVAGILLALLAGWVVFTRPAGDDVAPPSGTSAPTNQPSTVPPASTSAPPPTRPQTPRLQTSQTTRPVRPTGSSPTAQPEMAGPSRILVPQIGLSARVIPIAAADRVLTPPSNPRVVGWWSGGARPGARIGSAVVTAHTVHTGGGAFDALDTLRPGAVVTVITSTGRITYAATSVTNYPKQSLARHATELFDQTTDGRLVLVTCEDWNGKVYLSNVVVIAEPVR